MRRVTIAAVLLQILWSPKPGTSQTQVHHKQTSDKPLGHLTESCTGVSSDTGEEEIGRAQTCSVTNVQSAQDERLEFTHHGVHKSLQAGNRISS